MSAPIGRHCAFVVRSRRGLMVDLKRKLGLLEPLLQFHRSCSESSNRKIPAFIDYLQLQVCGGAGGQGLPKYGGFGGNGGSVIVVPDKKVKTLKQVLQKYPRQFCKAGTGENSNKFCLLGQRGHNLEVKVPRGVLVHKGDGEIVDLNSTDEICIVAKGGSGGNDKNNFLGAKGSMNHIGLELKLIADVGLVGFPNAGKSTFLKAISRAKPKIAAYPFTTIAPQLGIMDYQDGRKISVADLPGLIEGAHQNFGMGMKFLRHAERTKLLLLVLDVNNFQLSLEHPERSAFETLLLLNKELDEYGHGMLEKPAILAINKVDTDASGERVDRLLDLIKNLPDSLDQVSLEFHPSQLIHFDDVLTMSAKKRHNMKRVKDRVREVMDHHAERRKLEEMEEQRRLQSLSEEWNRLHSEHLKTTLV